MGSWVLNVFFAGWGDADEAVGRRDMMIESMREVIAYAEEKGVIVAAATPFRRLRTHYVLHVLNTLPIPLVVEGSKVVGAGGPLFIDVGMTSCTGAGFYFCEEFGGHNTI